MSYDEYAETLQQFDDDFDELPVYQGALPDGVYHAEITEARVEKTQWGNLQFVMTFQAVDGPSKGGTVTKYTTLDDSDSELRAMRQGIVKGDLVTLGFSDENEEGQRVCNVKLSELPHITDGLVDLIVEIKVQRKQYTTRDGNDKTSINVYINKRLNITREPDTF